MKELPEDYNIDFYNLLYYFLSKFKSECKSKCKNNKTINYKYIHVPELPLSAHAMMISNKGCKKLLNLIKKLNYHIDMTIAVKSNELNIYTTKKQLIYQTLIDSNNSDMSSNYLLNNYLKNIKNNDSIPYSYIFNGYVIKIYDTNITLFDIIFFLLGIFSYINKYLFIFILIFLIINQKPSILISYLIGYLIIYIIFNLNSRASLDLDLDLDLDLNKNDKTKI